MKPSSIRVKRTSLTLMILLCVSCASQASAPGTGTAAPKTIAGDGRLVFLSAADADREIGKVSTFQDPKSGTTLNSSSLAVLAGLDSQYDVGSACRLPPKPSKAGGNRIVPLLAAPLVALAGWAIQETVTWLANEISSDLQAQVNKYTKSYVIKSKQFDFYQTFTQNTSFETDKPYRSCIRLTSLEPTANTNTADPVLADLLIAVTHQPGQPSSVTIRPVRLFVSKVEVPTSDNQVAISYALSATSEARGINSVGAPETDFLGSLVAAKLDAVALRTHYFYKVYTGDEPGAAARDYSIPSWDLTGIGNAPKDDEMTLSITATEVGDIPWLLKQINNILQSNKDAITKSVISDLQKAASTAISPTATPKKTSS